MVQVNFASRVPIYEQIVKGFINLASAGVMKSGDKLPPVRTLAAELGINPNTVAKAYRELENDGYIYSTVGRGSFLTDRIENSAQKMIALDRFAKSTNEAHMYGASRGQLIEIIDSVYGGGETLD
ncbi:MAG TPA: GntR family transcriptional regulator [Ruminococcus sp.]|nr:GntR family transcriptional regulator [Ruminococcus sp.]